MTLHKRQDMILRQLRRATTTTVDALARETGTSRRTVLRDLSALRDAGIVIHSDVGRGGGLQLDPRSLRYTTGLTVTEVFALLISVSTLRAMGGLPFSELADVGLAKIERALPAEQLRELREFLGCLHISQLSPLQDLSDLGAVDPELLPAFEQSFLSRRMIRFHYRDANGAETDRQVEPQALLILPPLWYLVGWDPKRNAFRHFRMDRINAPETIADASFRRRHVPFDDDICPFSDRLPTRKSGE